MLTHPGFQLVPHVLPAVAEEHQPFSIEAEPITLNLSDYHRLPPLVGCSGCSLGGLGRGSLGAG